MTADQNATVLARLAAAEVRRRPFRWAVIDDLLAQEDAAALAAEFPTSGYREAGTRGTDYHFQYRDLISSGGPAAGYNECSARWRALAELLASDDYRQVMERLFGLSLAGLDVHAGLCLYPPGCQLRPHPDQAIRVVTQTIYFNDSWECIWGGSLLVLRSPDPADAEAEVAPLLGRSVVFVRSDHSWHAVGRVRQGVPATRKSLLMHYSR